jgi:hypothetical protein
MTLGAGTFIPSPKYWFIRAYINHVVYFKNFGSVSVINGRFTLLAPPPNPAVFTCQFDLNWWTWNSNKRTLDNIVTESFYKPDPSSPEIPMPFVLSFNASVYASGNNLYFYPFGGSAEPTPFTLPPAPSSYWLPPPLP